MTTIDDALAPVAPMLIGPRNCEAALGQHWRWTRRFAEQAGVPIWRLGKKTVIPAGPLMRAFEAHAAANQPPPRELTEEEQEKASEAELIRILRGVQRASR